MNKYIIKLSFVYIVCFLLSISIIYHFVPSITNNLILMLFLLVLGTLTLGLFLKGFIMGFLSFCQIHCKQENTKKIYLSSILMALLVVVMLPFNISAYHIIEIHPLAQKNSASLGKEVWLKELKIDDHNIPINEMLMIGKWEIIENTPVYTGEGDAEIKWKGEIQKDIKLKLSNHPYSGIVQITIDGKSQILDLYSPKNDSKEFILTNLKEFSFCEKGFILLSDLFLLSFFMYIIIFNLTHRSDSKRMINSNYKNEFIYILPIFFVWLIYFLTYYPGLMSGDSLDQWRQLSTLEFGDAHPIFDTLVKWLITRLWYSPAPIVIVQSMYLLFVLFLAFRLLTKLQVNKRVLWLLSIIFALLPVNSMMMLSLWKDIPYSISILFLTIVVATLYFEKENWLRSNKNIFLLGIALFLVLMFRHNGIISVTGTSLLLAIVYKSNWKRIFGMFLVVIFIFFGSKMVLLNLLDSKPSPTILTVNVPIQQVASMLAANVELNDYQKEVIGKAMNPSLWGDYYNKFVIDPLVFNPKFNMLVFDEPGYKTQFVKVWMQLVVEHPEIALKSWINQTSIIWRISEPYGSASFFTERGIIKSDQENLKNFDLQTDSLAPELFDKFQYNLDRSQQTDLVWLIWRPAIFILITILCALIIGFRNNFKSILIFAPVMLNVLGLASAIPAQQSRYLYSTILCSFFLVGLVFIKLPSSDKVSLHREEELR
ncbi:hypothetical protein G9G63_02035 [Paenibacillus sp. EKM202P]|uniref:DUF6020 family protein n=1 Tax=unclassified Paenibacillus TaxID=185978 RepID=UPI0013ECFBDF|nr:MULTISPECIES: DUF6020 family protein [unclassified Paenibacillus]KAF6567412.1 hypothetical protein G9G63_02035 [Paenibacillus sp. EKM202P]KAF6573474.1 hypothetical protein G9G64_01925 [Paenibacillus sp. EKM207P]